MSLRLYATALLAAIAVAAPLPTVNFEPDLMLKVGEEVNSYAERSSFEADPMLQVSDAESSYARRDNFKADPMLQVSSAPATSSYAKRTTNGKGNSLAPREFFRPNPMLAVTEKASHSSYAKDKRADFEADPMLQIGQRQESSYAE